MAVDSPRALFLYELGVAYEVEVSGTGLFGYLRSRVRNSELSETLHQVEQVKRSQIRNVEACMEHVGRMPVHTQAPAIGGLRERFQLLIRSQPSPEAVDLFALGTARRVKRAGITNLEELMDLSDLLNEQECKRWLGENLKEKRATVALLEQHSHDLRRRFFEAVPSAAR